MAPDDAHSSCFAELGLAPAARAAIERALVAIERALGPPTGWRLEQLVAAIEQFRLGRFDAALERARESTLPFEQIPIQCRCLHTGPGLAGIRDAVRRLGG